MWLMESVTKEVRNASTTPRRQPPAELFARSKRPAISLPENHPMVVLTDTVDWTEMEMRAEKVARRSSRTRPDGRRTCG